MMVPILYFRGGYRISERGGADNCEVLQRAAFACSRVTFLKFGGLPKGARTPPPLDPPLYFNWGGGGGGEERRGNNHTSLKPL